MKGLVQLKKFKSRSCTKSNFLGFAIVDVPLVFGKFTHVFMDGPDFREAGVSRSLKSPGGQLNWSLEKASQNLVRNYLTGVPGKTPDEFFLK